MKRMVVLAAMAALTTAAEYKPEAWQVEARQKFAEQRFGIFIHWGLYANYAQGEWYLQAGKLDEAAYARMMYGFYPSKFDAREWARTFKAAGAKYVTITSRHHDGFSLWPTKADDGYNIMHTPFKRDILGELAAACREEGLQLNFYYSLMDWHRKDYPSGRASSVVLGSQKGDYAAYKKFMMAQIAELIDSYRPGNIWFDGEWDNPSHDWQFDDIYDLIHARRTLVANNNHKSLRDKEDISLFERDLPGENASGFSSGQTAAADRPVEQCDVIQENVWGYRIGEKKFRTDVDVVAMVARAAAKGANLLMNIGPDGSGRLPERAVSVMEDVGKWFERNGESIYGTDGCSAARGRDVVATRRGNVLYLHFLNASVDKFAFRLDGEVDKATCLGTGEPVQCARTADGDAVVTVRRAPGDAFDLVVRLDVK